MPANKRSASNNNNVGENNNFESSFYEENRSSHSSAGNGNLKRPASLDLKINPHAKRQRITIPPPLSLEQTPYPPLNTPDIEKLILSTMQTPTTEVLFETRGTTEQDNFVGGFYDALNSLKNKNENRSQAPVTTQTQHAHTNGISGGSFTYTNLDESFPVAVKDEPQTVPGSPPPHSPIDMETQEKIKLERKRQRNRVAASKCRKRKLERISKLEDKVKCLKGENTNLGSVVKQLKDHVFQLKQQVINHINSGCSIPLYNNTAVLQSK